MREVTIYGITSHQASAGNFVEMYRMPRFPALDLFPLSSDNVLAVSPNVVERIQLRVHMIQRARRVPGVRQDGPRRGQDVDETYIAIEPELEELLSLPFKAQLVDAQRQAQLQELLAVALRQRLTTFNSLPWYRRVWVAIQRAA